MVTDKTKKSKPKAEPDPCMPTAAQLKKHEKIFRSDYVASFGTVLSPILREYWTSNRTM